MDFTLVTCAELPEPDPDAAPLAAALDAADLPYRLVAWSDPDVDWSVTPLTVIRSPWDYPLHCDAFVAWARRTSQCTRLCNPAEIVGWNAHKRYLLDLERQGIPVTPTVVLPQGDATTLAEVATGRSWSTVVVKPAVSCGSFKTICVDAANWDEGERHLAALLCERDMMVQQFLPSVEGYGERALVCIDGEITHAVRKTMRFEGQDESVSDEAMAITPAERALAERTLRCVSTDLLYARVDMAPGPDGEPVIMELELVEPSLFFEQSAEALARFVAGIKARLG